MVQGWLIFLTQLIPKLTRVYHYRWYFDYGQYHYIRIFGYRCLNKYFLTPFLAGDKGLKEKMLVRQSCKKGTAGLLLKMLASFTNRERRPFNSGKPYIIAKNHSSVTQIYSNIGILGTEYLIFEYENSIFWLQMYSIFVFWQFAATKYIHYSYSIRLRTTNIFDIQIRSAVLIWIYLIFMFGKIFLRYVLIYVPCPTSSKNSSLIC